MSEHAARPTAEHPSSPRTSGRRCARSPATGGSGSSPASPGWSSRWSSCSSTAPRSPRWASSSASCSCSPAPELRSRDRARRASLGAGAVQRPVPDRRGHLLRRSCGTRSPGWPTCSASCSCSSACGGWSRRSSSGRSTRCGGSALISGILMTGMAFWTAGQLFATKAYTLLVFAGIWALMQGTVDIVRAFEARG